MSPDDYKFITTLVMSVAGIQVTLTLGFMGLLYHANSKFLDAKFKAIEDRLDKIEKRLDSLEEKRLVK